MPLDKKAKEALDVVIKKSRVHFYKPIQIAEILFHHRTERGWDLNDLESYRNISKKWRDEISGLLVGRRSTSSQKYQDNVFESNAMPPHLLDKLGKLNKKGKGLIEAYIYKSLENRLASVYSVEKYIKEATADTFSLKQAVSFFLKVPGLKRSVDKMYEILVFALFSTIVRALNAQITLEITNKDEEIIKDFESFLQMVLGLDRGKTKLVLPASLYRLGVANAADRGLDMWSNFGAAIQVKHLTLTAELVEDIAEDIMAERIVIVCLDSEKQCIATLLKQVGWGNRIQGIVSIDDLDDWYKLCLSKKYRDKLGKSLLKDLEREFNSEFPSSKEIRPFIKKRKYDSLVMTEGWKAQ